MATCPQCGVSSREQTMTLVATNQWHALGEVSLPGVARVYAAALVTWLVCPCGWAVAGHLDRVGGHLLTCASQCREVLL